MGIHFCDLFYVFCLVMLYTRSLLCTVINGVTLALMDAGIAMTDMVCACSCGENIDSVLSFCAHIF